jgi:hypothetical protein
LPKIVKILEVERSASDLIVTAFDSQEGLLCMPWWEFQRKYGAQAITAVGKAGLNLNKLDRESRRLVDPRGTHEHDELGEFVESVELRGSVEDLCSSFDWT